jgi:hypothetical protein
LKVPVKDEEQRRRPKTQEVQMDLRKHYRNVRDEVWVRNLDCNKCKRMELDFEKRYIKFFDSENKQLPQKEIGELSGPRPSTDDGQLLRKIEIFL